MPYELEKGKRVKIIEGEYKGLSGHVNGEGQVFHHDDGSPMNIGITLEDGRNVFIENISYLEGMVAKPIESEISLSQRVMPKGGGKDIEGE